MKGIWVQLEMDRKGYIEMYNGSGEVLMGIMGIELVAGLVRFL